MTKTVYTNYWVNERAEVRRRHGSYKTEQEAVNAVKAWWEIHQEDYSNVSYVRTNRGALEILYDGPNYYYRIEKEEISGNLPSISYKVKTAGEIEALRSKYQLDEETALFDELAEPYRDRIILAMGASKTAREYSYTEKGIPVIKLETLNDFAN